MSILQSWRSWRISYFQQLSISWCPSYQICTFLIVFEINSKSYQRVRRTQRSTEKLCSFVMPLNIWIIHNIKNCLLKTLRVNSMNSDILFSILPCSSGEIRIVIILFRNWCESCIFSWWWNVIILLSYTLPFLTFLLITFPFFPHKLVNRRLIFIKMTELINSEMPMVSGNLIRSECFHIVFYWEICIKSDQYLFV